MRTAHLLAPSLVGKRLAEVQGISAQEGFITRVVMEDGFQYYVTSDDIPNRINLVLIDGVVVETSVG